MMPCVSSRPQRGDVLTTKKESSSKSAIRRKFHRHIATINSFFLEITKTKYYFGFFFPTVCHRNKFVPTNVARRNERDKHQEIAKEKPILQNILFYEQLLSARDFQKPRFSDLKMCPQAALTSQHEGHGFDSDLSVWNLHARAVPAWVHNGSFPTVQVCGLCVLILLGVACLRLNTAGIGCSNHHNND